MHKEAQSVDQPAQYQVVTAQQVKGHLRPSKKVSCIKQMFSYSWVHGFENKDHAYLS